MKILVLTNLYPPDVLGGYEMGCRQATEALRAAGHEVRVLTSVPRTHEVQAETEVHRSLKLSDVYDQYSMWKATPLNRSLRFQEAFALQAFNVHILAQAIENFQPDVVYAWNLIGLGGLGLLAAIQHLGVPWVMHLMDNVPKILCSSSFDAKPAIPAVASAFTRLCRGRFICCSQATLDEITDGGVPIADRTTIIPNWITTAGTPLRSDYRPGGHLRMISAGTICSHKGSDIIIRAATILRDRGHTNFSIDLFGLESDPTFRTMILSAKLEMVHLRGFQTQAELIPRYSNYDLFLFPTWAREPFGFAPLEAMAHGCAVMMSRVNGCAEWLADGAECIKVDRDPTAFADGIEQILRHSIPLEAIGRRAARTVQRWFSLDAVIPLIEAELETAIRLGGGPRRSGAEAYRVAQLAEKMFQGLVQELAA